MSKALNHPFHDYHIDLEAMFLYLSRKDILQNPQLQTQYLHQWKQLLTLHHNQSLATASSEANFNANEQFFDAPIIQKHHNINLHINFRIQKILECIHHLTPPLELVELPIEHFTNDVLHIKYNLIDVEVDYPWNVAPILIARLSMGKHNWIVIDGNHRLAQAIKLQHSKIKALYLPENLLLTKDCFLTTFDQYLYVFLNELSHFRNNKEINYFSDQKLLGLSFLNNHKVMFLPFAHQMIL